VGLLKVVDGHLSKEPDGFDIQETTRKGGDIPNKVDGL